MGTTIYGSYDDLMIELHGLDALRMGSRRIRIPLAEIESVQALDEVGGDADTVDVGPRSQPAVLIRRRRGGRSEVVAVHRRDAEEVAADLVRRGVGGSVALV